MASLADRITKSVRKRLSEIPKVDDSIALDIIIDMVFEDKESKKLSNAEISTLIDKIFYKTRSKYGILTPLINDKEISEIMVNGPKEIFVERNGKIEKSVYEFDSIRELEDVMQNIASIVHREINEMSPIVDARLEDGSRVNGVFKNIAIKGPTLTIRKFSDDYMSMKDLVMNETVPLGAANLLECLVESGYNIFVSGGTSSGKTTLLNALSQSIPKSERVIVIEDSSELRLNSIDNLVQLESKQESAGGKGRVSMSRLIKSSLRMRPDRIIVGEVRGEEVLDMLQAMNTGHDGSMSTGHGNSVDGMLKRLEAMYLMAMPLSIDAIRAQIAEGIEIMIHISKLKAGRRITEITELIDYVDGNFILNSIYKYDENAGLIPTGNVLQRDEKLKRKFDIKKLEIYK